MCRTLRAELGTRPDGKIPFHRLRELGCERALITAFWIELIPSTLNLGAVLSLRDGCPVIMPKVVVNAQRDMPWSASEESKYLDPS